MFYIIINSGLIAYMPPQQWSGSSWRCRPSGRWCRRWVQPGRHTAPPTPSPGGPCSSGGPPCRTEGGKERREERGGEEVSCLTHTDDIKFINRLLVLSVGKAGRPVRRLMDGAASLRMRFSNWFVNHKPSPVCDFNFVNIVNKPCVSGCRFCTSVEHHMDHQVPVIVSVKEKPTTQTLQLSPVITHQLLKPSYCFPKWQITAICCNRDDTVSTCWMESLHQDVHHRYWNNQRTYIYLKTRSQGVHPLDKRFMRLLATSWALSSFVVNIKTWSDKSNGLSPVSDYRVFKTEEDTVRLSVLLALRLTDNLQWCSFLFL